MSNLTVAMSGGVDSSVAAVKLLEAGHTVTALFMKNWDEDDGTEHCTAAADLADAEAVCRQLDIPLRTINFAHEYWTRVFQGFLKEYRAGRTPNPDIVCNKEIKFKEFLHYALQQGADGIATGHYAQIQHTSRAHLLCKATDPDKDQTYFLHTLNQTALKHTHFPLGAIHKQEVRAIARHLGLPTHAKKDSTGICFIGERRFTAFLRRYLPPRPGPLQTTDGETIGKHHGIHYYTIGQRRGLDIGGPGEAWYVAAKDPTRNILTVVQGRHHPSLHTNTVITAPIHWIAPPPPALPLTCTAKTRHRQLDQPCTITELTSHHTRIEFVTPQWAVAPGQSIALYQTNTCLGGAIIRTTSPPSPSPP